MTASPFRDKLVVHYMRSNRSDALLDELRDRMAAYLAEHQVCVISTTGPEGARAMPVRYRSARLEIDCILPRCADVAYHLEQDPRVALVVQDTCRSARLGRATAQGREHLHARRSLPRCARHAHADRPAGREPGLGRAGDAGDVKRET
jgi:hypothetical protein